MYFKTQRIQLILFILFSVALSACSDTKKPIATDGAQTTEIKIEMSDAAAALSIQIKANPNNAELYYQRGTLYFTEKYLDKALFDIEQAIKLDGQNPLYYFYKGKTLYAMNRTQDAAKAYESAIALKADYTEAQLKLAELYYVVKEYTKSINLLNTIIAAEPANATAQFFKGMNQKEMGDTVKAVATFQKTLDMDDSNFDAAIQLGLLFTVRKNPLALAYFKTALRLKPLSEEAYFARAFYYQETGKFQQALFDYRKVIDINPSNDRAYYNVGVINFDAKKYVEAMRSWDICIQMNNQYVEAYYMRGLVYELTSNRRDAALNYQFALELMPKYALAKEGLDRVTKDF